MLAATPDDSAALFGLATDCARLGLADQSRQALQKHQAEVDESSRKAGSQRGASADLAKLQHVLALTCSDAAIVYAGHRRLGKTEDLLRRGAEVDPTDVACRTKLAVLLKNLDRAPQAVPFCRQLIALEPKNPQYHQLLALVNLAMQQPSEARDEARRAVALAPDDEEYRRLLAELEKK